MVAVYSPASDNPATRITTQRLYKSVNSNQRPAEKLSSALRVLCLHQDDPRRKSGQMTKAARSSLKPLNERHRSSFMGTKLMAKVLRKAPERRGEPLLQPRRRGVLSCSDESSQTARRIDDRGSSVVDVRCERSHVPYSSCGGP